MLRFTLQRLIILATLLFLKKIIVFILIPAPPGDYLNSYLRPRYTSSGSSIDAEQIEALKEQFGLNQPIHVQYLLWVQNILRGDLGLSLEYQRSNNELIGERLWMTIILALIRFCFHLGSGDTGRGCVPCADILMDWLFHMEDLQQLQPYLSCCWP